MATANVTAAQRRAARSLLQQEFSRLGYAGTAPKTVAFLARQTGITKYSFN